jgi:hypothetical protein
MRTTIRLDERLLAEAKKHAAETGRTLTAVIEDALRAAVARRADQATRKPVRLKVVGTGGVRPGVDLDDSAGLADVMGP